jgi:hypothetical protein
MKKNILKFIGDSVVYDQNGTYIWGIDKRNNPQMIAEVRGYGAIQNLFIDKKTGLDVDAANNFQDEVGKFIAEAINEKLKRERNGTD